MWQDKQYSRERGKDAQLLNERRCILIRQCIAEWLVPGVESKLRIGGFGNDCDERSD
jgi:hypothetical protein